MFGYIMQNIVGQAFEQMPSAEQYHPDFLRDIIALPEGVSSGWQYIEGEFWPPLPEPEIAPELAIDDLGAAFAEGVDSIV